MKLSWPQGFIFSNYLEEFIDKQDFIATDSTNLRREFAQISVLKLE